MDDGLPVSFSSPPFLYDEEKGPNLSSCLCDSHIIYVLNEVIICFLGRGEMGNEPSECGQDTWP